MTQDKKRLDWVDARERRMLSQRLALNFDANKNLNEDLIRLEDNQNQITP